MRTNAGFIRGYLFFIIGIVIVAHAAYFIGKMIPDGNEEFRDRYAEQYEVAGVEQGADPQIGSWSPEDSPHNVRQAIDDIVYDTSGVRKENDIHNQEKEIVKTNRLFDGPSDAEPNSQTSTNINPSLGAAGNNPGANVGQTMNTLAANSANNTNAPALARPQVQAAFVSKNNDRVSFLYPEGSAVKEEKKGETLLFTITDPANKKIFISYDKVRTGCYDPIRSFAIEPNSIIDYRLVYPRKNIVIEGKYDALRSDEEMGSYSLAGNDPALPVVYTTNVCAQTAIPTRVRISTTDYRRGDLSAVMQMYDLVLGKMSL